MSRRYENVGSPGKGQQTNFDGVWSNIDATAGWLNHPPRIVYGVPIIPDLHQGQRMVHQNDRRQSSPTPEEFHQHILATFKTLPCGLAVPHDHMLCAAWHSPADRRRNPFEFHYTSTLCPNQTEHTICLDQDICRCSHNLLEHMYHPDVYKRTICQNTLSGSPCDRGPFCGFAHGQPDMRGTPRLITSGNVISKAERAAAVTVAQRLVLLVKNAGTEGVLGSDLPKRYRSLFGHNLESAAGAKGSRVKVKELLQTQDCVRMEMFKGAQPKFFYDIHATKAVRKATSEDDIGGVGSKMTASAEVVQQRLVEIIRLYSAEGVLGSDLPKKYFDIYQEKLEIGGSDDSSTLAGSKGGRVRLKDILASHPDITVEMYKKLQPRYLYTPGSNVGRSNSTGDEAVLSVHTSFEGGVMEDFGEGVEEPVAVHRSDIHDTVDKEDTAAPDLNDVILHCLEQWTALETLLTRVECRSDDSSISVEEARELRACHEEAIVHVNACKAYLMDMLSNQ
eukprot:gene27159-32806_t